MSYIIFLNVFIAFLSSLVGFLFVRLIYYKRRGGKK